MKNLTHSDSMRFCRRGRLFLYGIKKRSSQVDEYPINGCRHQYYVPCTVPSFGPCSRCLQILLVLIFLMHSAANFISGHCDLMGGVLVVIGERHDLLFLNIVPALLTECEVQISWAKNIYFLQNAEGAGLVPFDCWLCLRGTKMMVLRVENNSGLALKRLVDISMDSLLFSRSNWSL
ncbi:uncharacterized protein [Solanum lycopersicum]|uniref:uncharacterized protein isoform X1 n=1 Tax=Solanum lycopersicum TaxID=4081 RepID=UPI000532D390|nr:uncharacterized protein LOC101251113 isoform X1 [Solanum lycopersicum]XP_010325087.1 uncharacterized protein LOC101251113 isoform X1 [Solanum lycopersicum]